MPHVRQCCHMGSFPSQLAWFLSLLARNFERLPVAVLWAGNDFLSQFLILGISFRRSRLPHVLVLADICKT